MFLLSISSSFPEFNFSQSEVLEVFLKNRETFIEQYGLTEASIELAVKILSGDSGIDNRSFAMADMEKILQYDAGELNALFEKEATRMSVNSLGKALTASSLVPVDIDALFVCTCTGYICPGLTSHIAEQTGMRSDVYLNDIVGLGCGAAVPMLRAADGFLASNPGATVATVAVESCSSAFFISNDSGVIVSLCLFGDGASASIWGSEPGITGFETSNYHTLHLPRQREKIRFVNDHGKLRNKLHHSVPALAAKAVKELYGIRRAGNPHVLTHTGGKVVLDAIEKKCGFGPLTESREILRRHGNISSPSVLIALEEYLSKGDANNDIWLSAFGAGFSCHSVELNKNQSR